MPSESSEDEEDFSTTSDEETDNEMTNSCPPIVPLKTFVIAKVYSNAKKSRNFIAQNISGPNVDHDYEGKFLKKSSKIKNGFVFPEKDDLASVNHDDLICVLDPPSPVASTPRLSQIFKFSANILKFDIC